MKTLSPAMTQLISSVEHNNIAAQPEQSGGASFSLDTAEKAGALIQRLVQHKAQQSGQTQPDDSAMQAMLAMLLSRATPEATDNPTGLPHTRNIAVHLAEKQPQNATPKPPVNGAPASALKAQPLSAQLQALVAKMTASEDANLTPEQQSKLAVLRAQDPKQVLAAPVVHHSAHEEEKRVQTASVAMPHRPVMKEKLTERRAVASANTAAINPTAATQELKATPVMLEKTPSLPLQSEEWGEKLTGLLKDQIHFQINQQQQISTIRLDPPSLGKLDIAIQLDAGKLTVHIGASQPDVCRSLQQLSDQLRQQLTGQNFTQVEVNISADSGNEGQRQQQQRQQQHDDDIVTARTISAEHSSELQRDPLLIKV